MKDVGHAPIALSEAIDLTCRSESLVDLINDNMPDLPRRTALCEAKLKLDAVAMAVERRWFKNLLANKGLIESMHLFTDGSPVTGAEIQGMVLQIVMHSGEVVHIVMPGVCLHLGGARLI